MYVLYLILLWIHIEFYDDVNQVTTYILLPCAIYYLFFELVQLVIRRKNYIIDFWNIFDFFRSIGLVILVIRELTTDEDYYP
mmetsp:Transcript_13961/g.10066  ORF Transcript_13961/g.10066 Transcript_13961/m.10066 type:complete len:82 (+) Transcript_13961:1084-1329(+)